MALIRDSGEAEPYRRKKKKKKGSLDIQGAIEESTRRSGGGSFGTQGSPSLAPPAADSPLEMAVQKVTRSYFDRTGKLPAPDKTVGVASVLASSPALINIGEAEIWPDLISRPDDDDIGPSEPAVSKAAAAFEKREWRNPAAERIKREKYDIYTQGARADDLFYEPGKPNKQAIAAHANDVETKRYAGRNVLMSPDRLEALRETYAGKARSELSTNELADLDALALKLTKLYEFGDDYGNLLDNITWDKNFDSYVARYVIEGNMGYALGLAADKKGRKQEIAMKNIEVATHGSIKADDDVYEVFRFLGIKSDPNDPLFVSDKYSEWIYEGFANARRDMWSNRQTMFQFAAEFGEDMLPPNIKDIYTEEKGSWTKALLATEREHAGKLALIDGVDEPIAKFLYQLIEDVERDEDTWDTVKDVAFPEEEPVTHGSYGKAGKRGSRIAPSARLAQEALGVDIDYEEASSAERDYLLRQVIPVVMDVEDAADEDGLASWYEKGRNRVMLTLLIAGGNEARDRRYGKAGSKRAEREGERPRTFDTAWTDAMQNWAQNWQRAEDTQERLGDKSYMKAQFEQWGINWKDHGTALWFADFAWSCGADIWMDALTAGAFKYGKLAHLAAARKFLSPKLAAKVKDAEIVVKAAEKQVADIAAETPLKAGKRVTPQAADRTARLQSANKALADAKETLDLLNRPMWWDSYATALARRPITYNGAPNGRAIKTILNIHEAGLDYESRMWLRSTLDRIAETTDEDEVIELFNQIAHRTGDRLDPGAAVWSRARRIEAVAEGRQPLDALGTIVPKGRRLQGGADDAERWVESFGRLWNMGLHSKDKAIPERIAYWAERMYRAEGKTVEEIALNRREVWKDFCDEVATNMAKRGVKEATVKRAIYLAKLHGEHISKVDVNNMLKLYRVAKGLTTKGKRGRGASRFYNPRYEEDVATGVLKVVEGSKVTVASKRISNAKRSLDEARSRATELVNSGKGTVDEIAAARQAVADSEASLEVAHLFREWDEVASPFLEGQLAKDLYIPFDPMFLAAVQNGQWFNRALMHTGFIHGWGPSIHDITSAFRILALARVGFTMTAVGGDEAWRLLTSGAVPRALKNPKAYVAERKAARLSGRLDEATEGGNMVDLLRSSDSWDYSVRGDKDYEQMFSGYLDMLSNERIARLFANMERHEGESDAEFIARFKEELTDLIDDPASEELRRHLDQMHRIDADAYTSPEQLAGQQAAHERAIRESNNEVAEALAERDAISAEMFELRRAIFGRGERPHGASKSFKAQWLRNRYGDKVPREIDRAERAAMRGKLRSRKHTPVRDMTDDEVLFVFDDMLQQESVARQFADDWADELASRGGTSDELERLRGLQPSLDSANERLASVRKVRARNERRARPKSPTNKSLEDYIDDWADKMSFYARDQRFLDHIAGRQRLSRKDVKAVLRDLDSNGVQLPPVVSVKTTMRSSSNYIPGLSQFAELPGIGPFWLLDKVSNAMRRMVYVDNFTTEFSRLKGMGLVDDLATTRAHANALRYVDRIMYTDNIAIYEYLMQEMVLFLPAYRQFFKYWGGLLAKHPFLMSNLRQRYGRDWQYAVVGDYAMTIPAPFWMSKSDEPNSEIEGTLASLGPVGDVLDPVTGPLSALSENLPGVGPAPMYLLRTANMMTGWDEIEGKYVYTGKTNLDNLADIPGLTFMKKNSSPLMQLDDLMYGIAGERFMGTTQDSVAAAMGDSFWLAFWRDPVKRRQMSINIANAQISKGTRPDLDKAFEELREKPFWGEFFAHPEAALAAATRTFSPFGRASYMPADLGPIKTEDGKPFWSAFISDEARTMADAKYEYMEAYGDPEKMKAVLEKYPKYKAVQRFYSLDSEEREAYLQENPHIIPYITAKNNYKNGWPLVGGEYHRNLKEEAVYTKSLDEYLGNMRRLYADVQWSKAVDRIDADYEKGLKDARAFARKASLAMSRGNKATAAKWMEEYDVYARGCTDPAAGDEYTDPKDVVPDWLSVYANSVGRELPEYDPLLIERKRYDSLKSVEEGGLKPKIADKYGVAQYYSNGKVYDEYFDQHLGVARRVSDALKKYVSPEYRRLVDVRESVSYPDILKVATQHDEYNRRVIRDIATSKTWELHAPGDLLTSIGAEVNVNGLNKIGVELDLARDNFEKDVVGLDNWDDAYKKRRAAWIAEQDRILAQPGGEILRDGPAGRLLVTYLTKGARGKSPDKRYVESIVAALAKGEDGAPPLNNWIDKKWDVAKSRLDFDKDLAALSWTSTLTLAVRLRRKMLGTWNEGMESKRITPTSNEGEKYVEVLKRCVTMVKEVSPMFRRQWEEAGGDDLIVNMLSYSF